METTRLATVILHCGHECTSQLLRRTNPAQPWIAAERVAIIVEFPAAGHRLQQVVCHDHPPQAVNDLATTVEETPVDIAVRNNDTDIDGDTLSATAVTQGANGSVVLNADGTVSYTPALNFHGTDNFSYTIADPSGATSSATVNVTVTPVNDAPVAVNDSAATARRRPITPAIESIQTVTLFISHPICNARILYLHPITEGQFPNLSAPRRVPKVLDKSQPITSDKEQDPRVNEQVGLGTDWFRGHTRWIVDHKRVVALQGCRKAVLPILHGQQFAHAACAKPGVVRQPHPLDDWPRSSGQVGIKEPSDHLHDEDAGEPNGLSRFTTKGLAEVLDKRWGSVDCPDLSQLASDTLANAVVFQTGSPCNTRSQGAPRRTDRRYAAPSAAAMCAFILSGTVPRSRLPFAEQQLIALLGSDSTRTTIRPLCRSAGTMNSPEPKVPPKRGDVGPTRPAVT
jgi:hypothetical protein